jgi:hypothetical protein
MATCLKFAMTVYFQFQHGLPGILKIPDGSEKLSLPSANLPVSDLIKFPLPPQRKSTVLSLPCRGAKIGFF